MTNYTPEQRERAARQIYDMCSGDWGDMSIDQGIELQCALNAQAEELKEARELLELARPVRPYGGDNEWRGQRNAWLQRNEVKA